MSQYLCSFKLPIILLVLVLTICSRVYGQEENSDVYQQGSKYLSLRIKSLNKYDHRLERQQKVLLKRLSRKENKLAHKLEKTDSAGFEAYKHQHISFDSIRSFSSNNSNAYKLKNTSHSIPTIDTLRGIQSFLSAGGTTVDSKEQINDLRARLNFRAYVNNLIAQHSNDLKNLKPGLTVPGVTGIQKEIFYSKSKMGAFKQIEEEPTQAEDRALEALQGVSGFDKYLKSSVKNANSSMQSINGEQSMSGLGYQTKNVLQSSLGKKLAPGLNDISTQINSQLDKTRELSSKELVAGPSQIASDAIGNLSTPKIRLNSIRGLPFRQRFTKQYIWETGKSPNDNSTLLNISILGGFKQSKSITTGAGIAWSFGLGQSWQNAHVSFNGVGFKTYVSYDLMSGFGIYGGYERLYMKSKFSLKKNTADDSFSYSPHSTQTFTESVVVGLTKSYKINEKYSGQIQVLYDVWWQSKGLNTPISVRVSTSKK